MSLLLQSPGSLAPQRNGLQTFMGSQFPPPSIQGRPSLLVSVPTFTVRSPLTKQFGRALTAGASCATSTLQPPFSLTPSPPLGPAAQRCVMRTAMTGGSWGIDRWRTHLSDGVAERHLHAKVDLEADAPIALGGNRRHRDSTSANPRR